MLDLTADLGIGDGFLLSLNLSPRRSLELQGFPSATFCHKFSDFVCFEVGTHSVAQAILQLVASLLPPFPRCWIYTPSIPPTPLQHQLRDARSLLLQLSVSWQIRILSLGKNLPEDIVKLGTRTALNHGLGRTHSAIASQART